MAGLAKEFEQLDCWESATEEENIVIYGMDFEDEKVLLSLRMIWEKPCRCKSFSCCRLL